MTLTLGLIGCTGVVFGCCHVLSATVVGKHSIEVSAKVACRNTLANLIDSLIGRNFVL